MDDCIFCKMAAGEIPVKAVYETDNVLAFDDISPQAPVHTLVIPRKHYRNLSDNVPADLLGELFSAVNEVAKIKGVAESGYRVIVNNGPDANQTVPHLHVHVMGGRSMSHGMVAFNAED
jgi:histidine triad (HIT) family protein